jgi:hypothetical protein
VDYLSFIAVSCGSNRGQVFVIAKDPKILETFARDAGIKLKPAAGFIVDGADRIGAAADAIKALAKNDIPGIAGAAMVIDGQYRMLIIVDAENADLAQKAL